MGAADPRFVTLRRRKLPSRNTISGAGFSALGVVLEARREPKRYARNTLKLGGLNRPVNNR